MSLILTRRAGETIMIGSDVRVKVVGVNGGQVRISIDAPKTTRVDRHEVRARIIAEEALANASTREQPV